VKFVAKNPTYESDLLEVTDAISAGESNLDLGNYYYKKGHITKALDYYKKAYKTENQNFSLIKQILLLQIEVNQYTDALKLSDEGIEIYPAQPILYLLNGVTLNALNRPKEAIDTLEMGIDYIIEDAKMEKDFYLQLSQAHLALNNLDKAKAFKTKASKL
jgi:tetratricopeptide (TPR) repeat protein